MSRRSNRRKFLQVSAAVGTASFFVNPIFATTQLGFNLKIGSVAHKTKPLSFDAAVGLPRAEVSSLTVVISDARTKGSQWLIEVDEQQPVEIPEGGFVIVLLLLLVIFFSEGFDDKHEHEHEGKETAGSISTGC